MEKCGDNGVRKLKKNWRKKVDWDTRTKTKRESGKGRYREIGKLKRKVMESKKIEWESRERN